MTLLDQMIKSLIDYKKANGYAEPIQLCPHGSDITKSNDCDDCWINTPEL